MGELRLMARGMLQRESAGHTCRPTALALSALRRAKLKEQEYSDLRWENRAHFFSSIARAMRHALTDYARKRRAKGRDKVITLPSDDKVFTELPATAEQFPEQLLILEEALEVLEQENERLGAVVQMFYYLGHTVPEIARSREVDERTIKRDLNQARVRLKKLMEKISQEADP